MKNDALPTAPKSVDEFLDWSQRLPEGERYELVDGRLARMQLERIRKSDCQAFLDGVSVRIDATTLREPDALIHCGPYDPNGIVAENPVVIVEVASGQSPDLKKTLDYFSLESVQHYLILFPGEGRVLHQHRSAAPDEITTRIVGRDATIELSPPGISVSVEAFFAG